MTTFRVLRKWPWLLLGAVAIVPTLMGLYVVGLWAAALAIAACCQLLVLELGGYRRPAHLSEWVWFWAMTPFTVWPVIWITKVLTVGFWPVVIISLLIADRSSGRVLAGQPKQEA